VSCFYPPQLLADTVNLQMPIATSTVLSPVQRKPSPDHFRRQITAIFQSASGNGPFMGRAAICDSCDYLPTAQVHQCTFCILPVGMVKLRSIDASEANMHLVYHYGVAVDYPAVAADDLLPGLLLNLPQGF